ncbi:hypothetical protein [Endozoicomonas sp. SCSIO W0465]|uniref:hypothetical protein n=1 Tax=Endozoicomonas sp. SCSIO W0465 TaxID=2918516 RepID=UPI002074FFC9|nr:hypothetical protein [Endozoicomonas sp. SCSIO W0465]USE36558.1 hypothetical protein MJO57_31880 [Endozoicomonas sp. SCSIO W0465]
MANSEEWGKVTVSCIDQPKLIKEAKKIIVEARDKIFNNIRQNIVDPVHNGIDTCIEQLKIGKKSIGEDLQNLLRENEAEKNKKTAQKNALESIREKLKQSDVDALYTATNKFIPQQPGPSSSPPPPGPSSSPPPSPPPPSLPPVRAPMELSGNQQSGRGISNEYQQTEPSPSVVATLSPPSPPPPPPLPPVRTRFQLIMYQRRLAINGEPDQSESPDNSNREWEP